jgi:hypothetical protein
VKGRVYFVDRNYKPRHQRDPDILRERLDLLRVLERETEAKLAQIRSEIKHMEKELEHGKP